MKRSIALTLALLGFTFLFAAEPTSFSPSSSAVTDRAAIERVYYNHRLGTKPPFEQVLPAAAIEKMVRTELKKEAALKRVYGVEIRDAQVADEVKRIDSTTRAPEMLAEIKAALGNDGARFAHAVARPIVVERELRARFENDDKIHAPQRNEMERVRMRLTNATTAFRSSRSNEALTSSSQPSTLNSQPIEQSLLTSAATNGLVDKLLVLLKQTHSNAVTETTWQLGARPAETDQPNHELAEIQKRFGPNAQILSSPQTEQARKFYFEDLPAQLQNVLRVQLRQPGDVSAVIETVSGFWLYVLKEKTEAVLAVAGLSLPKRSYEQWLEEQRKEQP